MSENIEIKSKELSKNKIIALFQRAYRNYLYAWFNYANKHPKASTIIKKIFFFLVFSIGVTIVQFLIMLFLPNAFKFLGTEEWGFPMIPIKSAGNIPYIIFGDASGLGYFISFEIAVFIAQCINFPLQRNITFKSHSNPYIQALWYFIGWVLISVSTSALWGIINVYLVYYSVPDSIISIIKTMITGFLSMVVFFFIFLIIFPDYEKMYKKESKKLSKLKDKNPKSNKINALEEKVNNLKYLMNLDHLRKAKDQAFKEYDFKAFIYEKKRDDKTINEDEVKKAYDDALAKYMEMTTINKQYDEFLNSTTGMFN